MKVRICFALTLVFALPIEVAAQRTAEQRQRCEGPPGSGTVRGVLLNDSTGQPIASHGVILEASSWCMTSSDSAGQFTFAVPPGRYELSVGGLGYRRFHPIPIFVRADSTVEVELRLGPENLVADCRDITRCARLLESDPVATAGFNDAEQLEEAAWRTSIALAGGEWDSDWIPCADVESERIRSVLEARLPRLAHSSDCRLSDDDDVLSRRLTHLPTGAPARDVRLSSVEIRGDRAVTRSSYYLGPLWAEGWVCRYTKEDGEWVAQWCGLVWIS